MFYLYSLGVFFYSVLIKLASFFNQKAKLRISGINKQNIEIPNTVNENIIWIHCASVGEFEQARPLIEQIKRVTTEYKILLTFFSASGYELRKNYEYADYVKYLPADNPQNAKNFVDTYKPLITFFVKYEFWYHYLSELYKSGSEIYLVSGIFRENQIFFKSYGKFYVKILSYFTTLFVQNQNSKKLLQSIGIGNVEIAGDTRFDRVMQINKTAKKLEIIEIFQNNTLMLIAGSTWTADETIICSFINETSENIKLIIVPHEIGKTGINSIESKIKKRYIRFSDANPDTIKEYQVLIIDNIGMLSSLYQYADIAYIGGGFGKGIHNTLEAAVCGIPIIFGKKYKKFGEACELISLNAGFSIKNYQEFKTITELLISDVNLRITAGNAAKKFVDQNTGATDKILHAINLFSLN